MRGRKCVSNAPVDSNFNYLFTNPDKPFAAATGRSHFLLPTRSCHEGNREFRLSPAKISNLFGQDNPYFGSPSADAYDFESSHRASRRDGRGSRARGTAEGGVCLNLFALPNTTGRRENEIFPNQCKATIEVQSSFITLRAARLCACKRCFEARCFEALDSRFAFPPGFNKASCGWAAFGGQSDNLKPRSTSDQNLRRQHTLNGFRNNDLFQNAVVQEVYGDNLTRIF
jgi:hypothetical protein